MKVTHTENENKLDSLLFSFIMNDNVNLHLTHGAQSTTRSDWFGSGAKYTESFSNIKVHFISFCRHIYPFAGALQKSSVWTFNKHKDPSRRGSIDKPISAPICGIHRKLLLLFIIRSFTINTVNLRMTLLILVIASFCLLSLRLFVSLPSHQHNKSALHIGMDMDTPHARRVNELAMVAETALVTLGDQISHLYFRNRTESLLY